MLETSSPVVAPADTTEAFDALVHLAGRRTAPLPPDLLAQHVLALPGSWDWPVRRAAMEALLRRVASVREQELSVLGGPGRGVWGRYRLGRADEALPYEVQLLAAAPLRGSCDCADFLRGALGLCKHVLAILLHLARRPGGIARLAATPPPARVVPQIVWDATAVGRGPMNPLRALGLVPAFAGSESRVVSIALRSIFLPADAGTDPWSVQATYLTARNGAPTAV